MIIRITSDARKEADLVAKRCITKGIINPDDPRGVNGGTIYDRFYTGFLGEWAFNEFLKRKNVKDKIIWGRDGDRMAGDGDFSVGKKIMDVKTASKSFHKRLMIPVAQFRRILNDYYVATKITDDQVEILGYATGDDIHKAHVKDFGIGDTKYILHSMLRPINDLVNQQILKKWFDEK